MNNECVKQEACEGYRLSNCCGAVIYDDTDLCSDCKDHCSNQCEDCEEPCENKLIL